ncbi:hypothetical protein MBLNU459_g0913t1 [Dothideomycetes sp. NU459]
MDEDSPWGDVPSRSHSNSNLAKTADDDEASTAASRPQTAESSEPDKPAAPAPLKSAGGSKARPARRVFGAQSTTLEALDDSLGPLGPLGDSFSAPPQVEQPPAPPQKEQAARNAVRPPSVVSGSSSLRGMMESVNLEDEEGARDGRPRVPPPVQPPASNAPQRSGQPSVSIEQAAKPSFDIAVGDPHKVADMTGSHTVYQVKTKTSSKAYRNPEFTVSRRYRDFLWLYNQLHNNNPGVVVPPPPDKQTVGRFDAGFVESRRAALERMLNKTAAHPVLQHDGDLKLFLESESFNVDIKHKERKDIGLPEAKTGMFGAIGLSVGGGSKFIEHDDWFHDRKIYLDALENQLKALLKSTDIVVSQRKALAESCNDFSASLHALSLVELSPSLSVPLEGLSDIQTRIRDLYDRQAQQDVLTLGIVIDEYIRLIGSIKQAFQQRQKAYHSWHTSESALAKLKSTQEKLLRAGRTQQDRLSQMQADVGDAERRVHQSRLLFEDMGRLMRSELERFEREKVEDFKSGVETYLESAVEAQKELIELWETYLMQLDADDDGTGIPPAGVVAPDLSSSPRPGANPAGSVDDSAPRPSEDTAVEHEGATNASIDSAGVRGAQDDEDDEA